MRDYCEPEHPRPLKIAYLCDRSPLDKNLYSGGNAQMYEALCKAGCEITILPTGWGAAEPLRKLCDALPDALNLRVRWRLHLALSRLIGRKVARALKKDHYDVVLGTYAMQCMAGLKAPYPIVKAFISDATQTIYKRSEVGAAFGSYLRIGRFLDPWVTWMERKTYSAMDHLFWPTSWLNEAAVPLYGLDPSRSHVVPWGGNIVSPPSETTPLEIAAGEPVQLLLVGRDWFAKGGPLAFDTMQALRARGINARLTVIGTTPPECYSSEHVDLIGSLDKSDPAQMARFDALMRSAHFLVQPSYESYGFAFCEASAYGLPSLGLRVGGVPIRDGINGHALPNGSDAEAFADRIMAYVADPPSYAALRLSTRAEYETTLNWQAWARTVIEKLRLSVPTGNNIGA